MAKPAHFVATKKGGAGKTTVAAKLSQYLTDTGSPPVCIDTDPSNRSFTAFKGLDVRHVDVRAVTAQRRAELREEKHDDVFRIVEETDPDRDIVIDTGSSNFVQFVTWLLAAEVPDALRELQRPMLFHTVISGGTSQIDCLQCLADLMTNFPREQFVVWLNPFDGDLTVRGKRFRDMPIYQQNQERICGIVDMPEWDRRTRELLEQIFSAHQTFAEALEGPNLRLLDRRRLRIACEEAYRPIKQTELFG